MYRSARMKAKELDKIAMKAGMVKERPMKVIELFPDLKYRERVGSTKVNVAKQSTCDMRPSVKRETLSSLEYST